MLMGQVGRVRAHGTNQARTDRCAVGQAGATAATPAPADGPPAQGPPPDRGGDRVAGPHRGAVAGPARRVWPLGDGGQPVLSVASPGCVGPGAGLPAGPGRRARRAGLAAALRGRVGGAGPPECRRGPPAAGNRRPAGPGHGGLSPILTSRAIGRRWAAAAAATPPSCTFGWSEGASRWSSWPPPASATRR